MCGGVLCVGREREVVDELPVSVAAPDLSLAVITRPQGRVEVTSGYQRTQVGEHLAGEQHG